jgi:hypothetical protein
MNLRDAVVVVFLSAGFTQAVSASTLVDWQVSGTLSVVSSQYRLNERYPPGTPYLLDVRFDPNTPNTVFHGAPQEGLFAAITGATLQLDGLTFTSNGAGSVIWVNCFFDIGCVGIDRPGSGVVDFFIRGWAPQPLTPLSFPTLPAGVP